MDNDARLTKTKRQADAQVATVKASPTIKPQTVHPRYSHPNFEIHLYHPETAAGYPITKAALFVLNCRHGLVPAARAIISLQVAPLRQYDLTETVLY